MASKTYCSVSFEGIVIPLIITGLAACRNNSLCGAYSGFDSKINSVIPSDKKSATRVQKTSSYVLGLPLVSLSILLGRFLYFISRPNAFIKSSK